MSKYFLIEAEFKDEEELRSALEKCGVPFEQGETLPLFGYHGDKRKETADYVIRRKYIERSANDLGFRRNANGTFDLIVSQYDSANESRPAMRIVKKVKDLYSSAVTLKEMTQKRGYHVLSQEQEGNDTVIILSHDGRTLVSNRLPPHSVKIRLIGGGKIEATVQGVQGTSCEGVLDFIADMGTVVKHERTPDYYRQPPVTVQRYRTTKR